MSALAESFDDLDDFMSEVGPVDVNATIDPTLAERMLRRVIRERRKFDVHATTAKAQHDQVDAWLAARRADLDRSTEYLLACLQQYHEARLAEDDKAKTIHLPSGTLVARKQPDRWTFDEEAFVAWASEGDRTGLLRTKVEIDKPVVKQRLVTQGDGTVLEFETGEAAPGVTVEPGAVTFSVKADD